MVKLIQAKYIKQLFIFLVFALLFSYQQNVKADTDRSLGVAIRIMADNDIPLSTIYRVDELDSYAFGLLSYAVSDDNFDLWNNYVESRQAFALMLSTDDATYNALKDAASTVMVVDALSLLVGLIDELIAQGEDTARMDIQRERVAGDEAYNPIVVQAAGLGQIAAYSELFEGYRNFIRRNLRTTEFDILGTVTRDTLSELRGPFSSRTDYLRGRALQQTPECSNLFCSLYTLRLENPDTSIGEFVITQMQINEFYDVAIGDPTPAVREIVNNFIIGDNINANLNSLRQSRAATETVLPGNDPNPYQEPEISEECRMAPSLPGC